MLRRLGLSLLVPLLFTPGMAHALDEPWNPMAGEPLTGPRTPLPKDWVGLRSIAPETEILVMAGHADSQGLKGSGTPGEAVGRMGAPPMRAGRKAMALQRPHPISVMVSKIRTSPMIFCFEARRTQPAMRSDPAGACRSRSVISSDMHKLHVLDRNLARNLGDSVNPIV